MLSSEIRDKLKSLNLERYKFVVQVSIVQRGNQGIRMANKCFWDHKTDRYVTVTYANDGIICVVAAYGIYIY